MGWTAIIYVPKHLGYPQICTTVRIINPINVSNSKYITNNEYNYYKLNLEPDTLFFLVRANNLIFRVHRNKIREAIPIYDKDQGEDQWFFNITRLPKVKAIPRISVDAEKYKGAKIIDTTKQHEIMILWYSK